MNDFLESLLFEDEERNQKFDLEQIPFEVYKMQETDVLTHKFDELIHYRKQFIVNIINEKKNNYSELLQKYNLKRKTKELNKEYKQWELILDHYNGVIQSFNLVCHFCANIMTKNVVNFKCPKNTIRNLSSKS